MELLHNTTAVTICYYIEQREYFTALLSYTNPNLPPTSPLHNEITNLFKTQKHIDWVNVTVPMNRDEQSAILITLAKAQVSADSNLLFQSFYALFEFFFRNGHLYDALSTLLCLLNQFRKQFLSFHNVFTKQSSNTSSRDSSQGQFYLKWLYLIQTKTIDLKLIVSIYMGLSFETVDSLINFFNSPQDASQSTSPGNKTSLDNNDRINTELLGEVTSLLTSKMSDDNPQNPQNPQNSQNNSILNSNFSNIKFMSLYGGIDELIPPLTIIISNISDNPHNLVLNSPSQLSTRSATSPTNTPTVIYTTSDVKYGFNTTQPTLSELSVLNTAQNEHLIAFLSFSLTYTSLKHLSTSAPTASITHSLIDIMNSKPNAIETVGRDPVLSSSLFIALAFENMHKNGAKATSNRGYIYSKYHDMIEKQYNNVLSGADEQDGDKIGGGGDCDDKSDFLGDKNDRNDFSGKKSGKINSDPDNSNTLIDIHSVDALSLAPRINTQIINDWYQTPIYLTKDEKNVLKSNLNNPKKIDENNIQEQSFIFEPKFPIVSLIFIAFNITPEEFYYINAHETDKNSSNNLLTTKSPGNSLINIALMTYLNTKSNWSQNLAQKNIHQNLLQNNPQNLINVLNPLPYRPTPSQTSSILSQHPHCLLSVSTHDIMWLLTTSVLSSYFPSQLTQFTTLQRYQFNSLMNFNTGDSGSNDAGQGSSGKASGNDLAIFLTKNKQILNEKTLGLYPNLVIPSNLRCTFDGYINMLRGSYKDGSKATKSGQNDTKSDKNDQKIDKNAFEKKLINAPQYHRKPIPLFLFELSAYIGCYPYLQALLDQFNTITNLKPIEPQNSQEKNDKFSFSLSHLIHYVYTYGHYSPFVHTVYNVNPTRSQLGKDNTVDLIIQSIYISRILIFLPILKKLKFSRFLQLFLGIFNQNEIDVIFEKNLKINYKKWLQYLIIQLYNHIIKKRLISAKLSVTDSLISKKLRLDSSFQKKLIFDVQNVEQNVEQMQKYTNKINTINLRNEPNSLKSELYHIEIDQYGTSTPIPTNSSQSFVPISTYNTFTHLTPINSPQNRPSTVTNYRQPNANQRLELITHHTTVQLSKRQYLQTIFEHFQNQDKLTPLVHAHESDIRSGIQSCEYGKNINFVLNNNEITGIFSGKCGPVLGHNHNNNNNFNNFGNKNSFFQNRKANIDYSIDQIAIRQNIVDKFKDLVLDVVKSNVFDEEKLYEIIKKDDKILIKKTTQNLNKNNDNKNDDKNNTNFFISLLLPLLHAQNLSTLWLYDYLATCTQFHAGLYQLELQQTAQKNFRQIYEQMQFEAQNPSKHPQNLISQLFGGKTTTSSSYYSQQNLAMIKKEIETQLRTQCQEVSDGVDEQVKNIQSLYDGAKRDVLICFEKNNEQNFGLNFLKNGKKNQNNFEKIYKNVLESLSAVREQCKVVNNQDYIHLGQVINQDGNNNDEKSTEKSTEKKISPHLFLSLASNFDVNILAQGAMFLPIINTIPLLSKYISEAGDALSSLIRNVARREFFKKNHDKKNDEEKGIENDKIIDDKNSLKNKLFFNSDNNNDIILDNDIKNIIIKEMKPFIEQFIKQVPIFDMFILINIFEFFAKKKIFLQDQNLTKNATKNSINKINNYYYDQNYSQSDLYNFYLLNLGLKSNSFFQQFIQQLVTTIPQSGRDGGNSGDNYLLWQSNFADAIGYDLML